MKFVRIIKAFILPSLLMMGTMIFCIGNYKQSTIVGNYVVSIICGVMIIGGSGLFIIVGLYDYLTITHKKEIAKKLSFSFVDNSILLTLETINKNGYDIIWEQEEENRKQILCFNESENDFKAFDRYQWSDENNALKKEISDIKYPDCEVGVMKEPSIEMKATELWTPIKLRITNEWLKDIF